MREALSSLEDVRLTVGSLLKRCRACVMEAGVGRASTLDARLIGRPRTRTSFGTTPLTVGGNVPSVVSVFRPPPPPFSFALPDAFQPFSGELNDPVSNSRSAFAGFFS